MSVFIVGGKKGDATDQISISGTGPVNTLDGCKNILGWS
jgi:hypothetical protein